MHLNQIKRERLFSVLIALSILILPSTSFAQSGVCWKTTYGRGVGTVPTTCGPGQEKSGLLCYPNCPGGFKGVGPVCWQNCPSGFRDDGAFCAKPGSYGRGAGYAIWSEGKCKSDHGSCEKCLLMYYPKCKPGFKAVGCNVCSPICPSGMRDIGVSCAKQTSTRATIMPGCGDKTNQAGLCYNACKPGYKPVGPVCWGQCRGATPIDCGALCGASAEACAQSIINQVVAVGEAAAKIAVLVSSFGASAGATTAGSVAVQAGQQAAAASLKETAKEVAKELLKKFGNLAADKLKEKLVPELKNVGISDSLAGSLSSLVTSPDSFDYMSFLKTVDPVGITKVVEAFNKQICTL